MTDAITIAAQIIQPYESCAKKLPSGLIGPYLDARGIPTIGWGNTQYENGLKVTIDDSPMTQLQVDTLFEYYLRQFSINVALAAPGATPNELGAFTSLAYNIGLANFHGSTTLREYLRGDKALAGSAIELWDRAGGQVLKGLQRRRRAEHLVFDGALPAQAILSAEQAFP